MFYNVRGWAIAYCQDRRTIYAFCGEPLAYLDGDSVYRFDRAGSIGSLSPPTPGRSLLDPARCLSREVHGTRSPCYRDRRDRKSPGPGARGPASTRRSAQFDRSFLTVALRTALTKLGLCRPLLWS